jgi:hypothetical protein
MLAKVRDVLDCLPRPSLSRLCSERGLTPDRDIDSHRKTLAHSFHGRREDLIFSLHRTELVEVFRKLTFLENGESVRLASPSTHRLDELHKIALWLIAGQRRPRFARLVPVDNRRIEADDTEDNVAARNRVRAPPDEEAAPTHQLSVEEVEHYGQLVRDNLRLASGEWSRPRQIDGVLKAIGREPVQRLRTDAFRYLIWALDVAGVEACLADDLAEEVLSQDAISPGIHAKLRLRISQATTAGHTIKEQGRGVSGGAADGLSSFGGGPPIVVRGEDPIAPRQVARLPDYSVALLQLQFLTAVPSPDRGTLPAWPMEYLAAATRGLTLRPTESALLRPYLEGLRMGIHSPDDAIRQLCDSLSSDQLTRLLVDFQALNPFFPEVVREIVERVVNSRRDVSQGATARGEVDVASAPAAALDVGRTPQRIARTDVPQPQLSAPANQRDLGALAGMFDDE